MYLGQRIMAAGMEGVAFQHASAGKQKGFKKGVFLKCLQRIGATGGSKTATGRKKRRYGASIEFEKENHHRVENTHHCLHFRISLLRSFSVSAQVAIAADGRAIITPATPKGSSSGSCRKNERTRRFTLFR